MQLYLCIVLFFLKTADSGLYTQDPHQTQSEFQTNGRSAVNRGAALYSAPLIIKGSNGAPRSSSSSSLPFGQQNGYSGGSGYNRQTYTVRLRSPNITLESDPVERSSIKREYQNDDSMHYPSSEEDTRQTNNSLVSSNCAFGLCEDVENYPADEILSKVNKSDVLKLYFKGQTKIIDIHSRFKDDGDPLCQTMVHTVFPKSAVNVKKVEMLLVNVEEYRQGVVYETCRAPDKPCGYAESFPQDIVTSCKQKYIIRRMLAKSADSTSEPIFDNFSIPSCCVCTTKKL